MNRRPWKEWLTREQYKGMFPGGQADLDAFYDRCEERERLYGGLADDEVAELAAELAANR